MFKVQAFWRGLAYFNDKTIVSFSTEKIDLYSYSSIFLELVNLNVQV